MGQSNTTLREATLDDCVPASALLKRLGLGAPLNPAVARRAWEHLWKDNPSMQPGRPRQAMGFVLEAQGEIVGFFGSIPRRYQLGDRALSVAVGSQWGVEKAHRMRTKDISTAYFTQPGVDLFLATTCNKGSGRIYERFGATPMPIREFDRVLFWVLDAARFVGSVLRKREVSPLLATAGALALGPLLAVVDALPGRRPGRHARGLEPEVIPLSTVGDEFDDLWARAIAGPPRLFANRTAEELRWHYGPKAAAGTVTLLRCRRGGRLAGYLVLLREEVPALRLVRSKIVDMLVAGDDAIVVDALLAAAYDAARGQGAHVLELVGFPRGVRARGERAHPFRRMFPGTAFYYKPASPELAAALGPERAWYPTFYDGDSTV